jgi:hypothetical protein
MFLSMGLIACEQGVEVEGLDPQMAAVFEALQARSPGTVQRTSEEANGRHDKSDGRQIGSGAREEFKERENEDSPRERPDTPTEPIDGPIEPPDGPDPSILPACEDTLQGFFVREVWEPFMSTSCQACHSSEGYASGTSFHLLQGIDAASVQANLTAIKNKVDNHTQTINPSDSSTWPRILQMPTEPWYAILSENSQDFSNLMELVLRIEGGEAINTACDERDILADVENRDFMATLDRALFTLAGRRPTSLERANLQNAVNMGSHYASAALSTIMDDAMQEDGFYSILKEWFNDVLLTDKHKADGGLLHENIYPQRKYYDSSTFNGASITNPDFQTFWNAANVSAEKKRTKQSLGQAPLELIADVVKNNEAFTKILTAEYMLANPYGAVSLGLVEWDSPTFVADMTQLGFTQNNGAYDAEDFQEVLLSDADPGAVQNNDVPHAGILTDIAFLKRYPTASGNRNRHRAYTVMQKLLGLDLFETLEPPMDFSTVPATPTMNSVSCSICHARMEPIAGTFQKWGASGIYNDGDTWYNTATMFETGYMGAALSADPDYGTMYTESNALQWLGAQMAQDPRFAKQVAAILFEKLTGQAILKMPRDTSAAGYFELFEAYRHQQARLDGLASYFTTQNFDLKALIKAIVWTPYFRAASAGPLNTEETTILADFGSHSLLTPEQLDRRLGGALDVSWPMVGTNNLTSASYYGLLYGGIDSSNVVNRLSEVNAMMVNVAERMANETACGLIQNEVDIYLYNAFNPNGSGSNCGTLLPGTCGWIDGLTSTPTAIWPEATLKDDIRHLFSKVLNEDLGSTNAEIDFAYGLYEDVFNAVDTGVTDASCGLQASAYNANLSAWSAVLSYLLQDAHFLFQE